MVLGEAVERDLGPGSRELAADALHEPGAGGVHAAEVAPVDHRDGGRSEVPDGAVQALAQPFGGFHGPVAGHADPNA